MTGFEHLLKSYDVGDELDAIASSDPPAYLRRCFAEGISSPELSFARVQQLTVCVMVLDSILNDREYESLEPELVADWRAIFSVWVALSAFCLMLADISSIDADASSAEEA